ncbi:DUF4340 domain-containing protein [Ancylothrix sp. C2]|uniref:DUF4340 domain-containing protein n=1 Tax=Ancylothrix sp. D3o TaxID=2953691 RepID=UPI0021BB175A|nr:DUF4340 domain-containing protein [Ancylothrix sp. D3o]MCT7952832.1 DUF4340 domain-containing protein [Ancylothrix sp. D3o]
MKIQKTTLILMVSAVLLGSFVYFYEVQGSPKREQVKAEQQQLFKFKESDVQAVTLTTQKQTLKFDRQGEKEPVWMLQVMQPVSSTCEAPAPKETDKKSAVCEAPSAAKVLTTSPAAVANNDKIPASDASVAYLLNLVASAKFDRKITMSEPQKQRQEYGLDAPLATVEVRLKNQQSHRLVLGKPDFNKSFLYAQVDPPANVSKALDVVLVPADFQNAVDRPVSEWKKEEAKPKSEEKSEESKPLGKEKESTIPAKDKQGNKEKTPTP